MTSLASLLGLILLPCGCSVEKPSPVIVLEDFSHPYDGMLVECLPEDAEALLEIDVFTDEDFWPWHFEIPICRAKGDQTRHPMGYFCTAGTLNGRSGYITIEPAAGDAVALKVKLSTSWIDLSRWERRHGELDQLIETVVWQDGEKSFQEGWSVEWIWKAPRRNEEGRRGVQVLGGEALERM